MIDFDSLVGKTFADYADKEQLVCIFDAKKTEYVFENEVVEISNAVVKTFEGYDFTRVDISTPFEKVSNTMNRHLIITIGMRKRREVYHKHCVSAFVPLSMIDSLGFFEAKLKGEGEKFLKQYKDQFIEWKKENG